VATSPSHASILIVGGGAGGISVASALRHRRPDLDITLIEPSEEHYYQAAFTLVGGGTYEMAKTARPQKSTLPEGATWIQNGVARQAETVEPMVRVTR